MRVMTWNLWWRFGPWEARQPAIAATIGAEDPDIVCLQEVWGLEGGDHQAELLADRLGRHVVRGADRYRNGRSFGNAILSRYPVRDSVTVELPPFVDGVGYRTVVAATLDAPDGPIPVFTTHLAYRFDEGALRDEQLRRVAELVAQRRGDPDTTHPPILAGDLNAVPTSDEIRRLTGEAPPHVEGLVFTDAWPQGGDGSGATWHDANPHVVDSAWPRRRIDYVMVGWPRPRPLGNVVGCHLAGVDPVDGVVPSDHYAVVADLVGPTTG